MLMRTNHTILTHSAIDLDGIADDTAHLVLTSPPYPMIEMWDTIFSQQIPAAKRALEEMDGPAAFEAMHALLDKVWAECWRTLADGGFLCVNIGDATRKVGENFRLYTNHSRITAACEALGFQSLPAILWRKQTNAPNKFMGSGMLPAGAYVTLEHEYILVFRKGDKRVFNKPEKELRRASAVFWEERNQWFSDLWDFKGIRQAMGDAKTRKRSGAFPFELAWRLIHMYSLQGETVLDPFLGTGTTLAAAIAAGRSSVGCEIDIDMAREIPEHFDDYIRMGRGQAARRIESHQEFVAKRQSEGKPFKYENEPHGFPVVTRQETGLKVLEPISFEILDELKYQMNHKMVASQETLI